MKYTIAALAGISLSLALPFALNIDVLVKVEPEPPPEKVEVIINEPVQQPAVSFKVEWAEVSAYSSDLSQTDDTPDITANGTHVHKGVIACPVKLKFGTKVEINGTIYTCADRMNARYQYRNVFDIWVEDTQTAIQWGRKQLQVKILTN